MKLLGLVLIIALAAGCEGCNHPLPQPAQPMADGAAPTAPTGPATCLDVCRHGQQLGCTWANDTDMGANCATVCANNQAAGIAGWNLDCMERQSSCPAVDSNCH